MPGGETAHAVPSLSFTGHDRRQVTEPVLLWAQDFYTFMIRVILVVSALSPSPAFDPFVCTLLALQNSSPSSSLASIPLPGARVLVFLLLFAPPSTLNHAVPPRRASVLPSPLGSGL